jgi:hypothetical protein
MQEVVVHLVDWEHQCCGDERAVGDEVSLEVYVSDGQYMEQRHDYDNETAVQAISGQITGIAWVPAVLLQVDKGLRGIAGYGTPGPIQSTADEPDAEAWEFLFTVVTNDTLPAVG